MAEEVMRVSNIGKKYKIISNKEEKDTFAAVLFDSLVGGFKKKSKDEGEFWALKDVSFTVNKGERVGIIGHNGAGKSTLLKVFSRITVPTEGKVEVKGRIASLLEVGTGFNMELTGRENIYLNGSILGMSRQEIDNKFNEIVEFSEVGDFLDIPVKRYSSGMFVKLAFAVSAHLDPDILIVDEVLAVGDMKFQQKCLGKMEDVAEGGRTVLYVSHSMNTIQQLCTRVIVMDHGKIIFDGDVDEGIKIYMDNNNEVSSYKNFDKQKRQGHIVQKAHMISSKIRGNEECLFNSTGKLNFTLNWKAYDDLTDLRLRAEILYSDNTPAGTCFSNPFINAIKDEEYESEFIFDINGLAPGRYSAIFVLYELNEYGAYNDVDRVEKALNFEVIIDEKEFENISWTHRWWGHVIFPNLKNLYNENLELNNEPRNVG